MEKKLEERVKEAIAYIQALDAQSLTEGKTIVDENFYYMVQSYTTKQPEETCFEAHRKYIDIQYIVAGEEVIQLAPVSALKGKTPYQEEGDYALYEVNDQAATIMLTAGSYGVFYPQDGHRPGICTATPAPVKKIVGKVRI